MNAQTQVEAAQEAAWPPPKQTPTFDSDALKTRWESVTQRVSHFASLHGWSKSEVARRADMAIGTFSSWYDGTYTGRYDRVTLRVENFLASVIDAASATTLLPNKPQFIQTRVARELFETFTYAQALPTIALVTVVAGLGKTCAAEAFRNSRPHVFLVTLSPSSTNPHTLKTEIAQQLGINSKDARTLKQGIVQALRRDGFSALLIIDEAQNLDEAGINELRHFRDVSNCGLVLLGNNEATTPYASADIRNASPQVTRRIGYRMKVMKPYAEDIEAFMDGWGLEDPETREVATKIARRAGAFGALEETILAGSMSARGQERGVTADDLRNAYERRGQGRIE